MKTNLTKILVLVLSLALLVGAVIGISASAEEYTYEIKSMNIAHGDTTVVLVAVDAAATGVAPEGVTVTYVDADGVAQTAKYYGDLSVYGTTYPVYYTKGISAKDLGQDVIATVTVGDEVKDTMNASVAEYLYGKLYKEGYINATATKDVNRKNLYLNLLDYAASAETVLWNDKDENAENQRTLITDKFYVYAEGIGEDVIAPTETFTLNYTGTAPEGYTFSGYWKSTIAGNSIVVDGEATAPTVHGAYSPVFYLTDDVAGKYYNSETDGTKYDFTELLALDVAGNNYADLSVYNAETNPNGLLAGALKSADGYAALITNKKATLNNSNGKLVYAHGGETSESIWSEFSIANKGNQNGKAGSTYIFEVDFTYLSEGNYTGSSSTNNQPLSFGLTSASGILADLNGINEMYYANGKNALILHNTPLVKGVTYNILIKYTVGGTYQMFIDGECVYTTDKLILATGSTADVNVFAGVGFAVRARHAGSGFSFSVDNVFMGNLDSYFDDKTIEGTRYDFNDAFTMSGYDAVNNPTGLFTKDIASGDDSDKAFNTNKNTTLDNSTGALILDMSKSAFVGISIANKGNTVGAAGDTYIFEADFTWMGYEPSVSTSTSWSGGPFGIGFTSSSYTLNDMFAYNYVTYPNSDSSTPDAKESGHTILNFGDGTLNLNETHKIRLEYTVGSEKNSGSTRIYVDNVLVKISHNVGNASDDSSFLGVAIYVRGRHAGTDFTFSLDNVFMTTIHPQ